MHELVAEYNQFKLTEGFMKNWKFFTKLRLVVTAIISLLLVFYLFNFVPRNINIVASRSLAIKIFDYILNFIIFFVVIYIAASLIVFVYQSIFKSTKKPE